MINSEKNKNLWTQRITLLMVVVFCGLVSVVEYFPQNELVPYSEKEINSESDHSTENQAFLAVAVDAVVPFVITLSQQVFYLIYEIVPLENPVSFEVPSSISLVSQFWEILFERIISPNAP